MPVARLSVKSEIAGVIVQVVAPVGSVVAADDPLLLLESMKMEIPVPAPRTGRVVEVPVDEGDLVAEGDVLAVLEV